MPAIAQADLEERRDELGSDCAVTDQRAGHGFGCPLFSLIHALQELPVPVKRPSFQQYPDARGTGAAAVEQLILARHATASAA